MLYDLLVRNPFRKWFLIVLVGVNVIGSVYGYYWYSGQLAATPFELWLFTFDSPFSTTLFAVALLAVLFGLHNRVLELLAYTGVIKYGLWAAVVIIHYWLIGGSPQLVTSLLLLSHLGMAVEGYVFIRHLYVPRLHFSMLLLWFAVSDYMDYIVGVHPYLYHPDQLTVAAVSAVGLSLLILIYVWYSRLEKRRYIFSRGR